MSEEKNTDQRTWIMQDVPKIFVESEDEKGRYLLETEIGKDEGYQKQQGLTIAFPDRDTRQETDRLRRRRNPDRVDGAQWNGHGAQFSGGRRLCGHLVCPPSPSRRDGSVPWTGRLTYDGSEGTT